MIANSGRFKYSKSLLLGDKPFDNFLNLTNWLHAETDQTHKIALPRLFNLLFKFMTTVLNLNEIKTIEFLLKDYEESGIKGQAKFMQQTDDKIIKPFKRRSESRQKRHQTNG